MNLANLKPGEEYDGAITVQSVEATDIQTGAYFCEPTEKTKKVHEHLIQLCLDQLDGRQKQYEGSNPQRVAPSGSTENGEKKQKRKKYRKRTDAEKQAKKAEKNKT